MLLILAQTQNEPAQLCLSGPCAPPAVKRASVESFMVHLYWSTGEAMPTGKLGGPYAA